MARDREEYLYWAVKSFICEGTFGFEIKHPQKIKTALHIYKNSCPYDCVNFKTLMPLLGEWARLLKMCLKVAWEPARVGFTAVPGSAGISCAGFGVLVDWVPTGTKGRPTWGVGSAGLGVEQMGSWVVVSESCLQGNIRNGVPRCITSSHRWHRGRAEDLSGVAWIL